MSFIDDKSTTRATSGNLIDPFAAVSTDGLTTSIVPSPTDSDLGGETDTGEDNNTFDTTYTREAEVAQGDDEEDLLHIMPAKKKSKLSRIDSVSMVVKKIEEGRLKHFREANEREKDDDRHFLLSLLPYMHQVCF